MTNKVLGAPISQKASTGGKGYLRIGILSFLLIALTVSFWLLQNPDPAATPVRAGTNAISVVTAAIAQRDVPIKFKVKGTVSSIQTVEIRPQIAAMIKTVHIKEGQFVKKGERLFTLDTRAEEANLSKSIAQLAKTRVELQNAQRQFNRQRELFRKNFISQAALDVAENQVELLQNQLSFDQAAVEANRVARDYGEIVAPIAGRTGAIQVYPGSLVRPESSMLVSITQINPIYVNFVLPERELSNLNQAFANREVRVIAQLNLSDHQAREGRIVFIDSAVDSASGTIQIKAEFDNTDGLFWPGMFANVTVISRVLPDVLTVPAQALQSGPQGQFLFVVGEDNKVMPQPINVRLIQEGTAIVEGIKLGQCVVIEGTQNLHSGSMVNADKACGQEAHSNQTRTKSDSENSNIQLL